MDDWMMVEDLNREQLAEVKRWYLYGLADCGDYAEVLDTDHDEPTEDDLKNADSIVPDEAVFDFYDFAKFYIDENGNLTWKF